VSGYADFFGTCAIERVPEGDHVVNRARHQNILADHYVCSRYIALVLRGHLLAFDVVAALCLLGVRDEGNLTLPAGSCKPEHAELIKPRDIRYFRLNVELVTGKAIIHNLPREEIVDLYQTALESNDEVLEKGIYCRKLNLVLMHECLGD